MDITIRTEWLVRQVDRVGRTPEDDAKLTKAGDVIVIKRATCNWSQTELESDNWIIIKTNMRMSDARHYIAREPGFYEEKPLLKARNKHLQIPALVQAIRNDDRLLSERPKLKLPRNTPFVLSKEVISEFTRVKGRTKGQFE